MPFFWLHIWIIFDTLLLHGLFPDKQGLLIFSLFINLLLKFTLVAVEFGSDNHVFEFHDIPGQRACFIGENVTNLPKILDYACSLDFDKLVTLPRIHKGILFYVECLDKFADLESYLETHRKQSVQQKEICEERK